MGEPRSRKHKRCDRWEVGGHTLGLTPGIFTYSSAQMTYGFAAGWQSTMPTEAQAHSASACLLPYAAPAACALSAQHAEQA